ncbi:MAG: hypothetical protein FK734_10630 [Asgard group archaeon]|nr:hypothetical protein [Asgard group archaeon]
MSKKKGPYRKSDNVEIIKDYGNFKKGEIREVHPVLRKRLEADGIGKLTKKEVNIKPILPSASLKEKSDTK